MSVLVYRDGDTLCQAGATLLAGCIIEKPTSVLGLDCSQSLSPLYRKIAGMTSDGLLDWTTIRAFNLFEHVQSGAPETDEARMRAMLYNRVNILPENIYSPNTNAQDWSVACNDYENAILDAGGLDTLVCTVGRDGRIACNLPSSELAPITHVERTETGRAVTLGISTIMSAKRVIAVLSGFDLAPIAGLVITGPVVPTMPASYLQLHPNAIFMLDEEAADQI
ncbi:MAG TPA: 6-phosphogluconolactonase [Eubacteriales bacterium]|nr:6-phosphogluconolactonase [Eubacteriales bacterium]